MKEFVEKLIERLEEKKNSANSTYMKFGMNVDSGRVFGFENSIEIVNQLAEEYVPETNAGKWIPCMMCESCEYKECEHHGKI